MKIAEECLLRMFQDDFSEVRIFMTKKWKNTIVIEKRVTQRKIPTKKGYKKVAKVDHFNVRKFHVQKISRPENSRNRTPSKKS